MNPPLSSTAPSLSNLSSINVLLTQNERLMNQAAIAVSIAETTQQAIVEGEKTLTEQLDGMKAIRETVNATTGQIERLDNSTKQIAQVVTLIRQFAAQTHLLALKASIEAARAGEGGRGFAVIAEEVRTLAAQSAEATASIEALVVSIQAEARDVAETLTKGKQQLNQESHTLEKSREHWQEAVQSSLQLPSVVQKIAETAGQQTQLAQLLQQELTSF
ncbi:MAG: methyl-accepting chemotaxis protein [Snowella sp.]|nr:methyl-accepting chemotaxis protein [Snowella sp.]